MTRTKSYLAKTLPARSVRMTCSGTFVHSLYVDHTVYATHARMHAAVARVAAARSGSRAHLLAVVVLILPVPAHSCHTTRLAAGGDRASFDVVARVLFVGAATSACVAAANLALLLRHPAVQISVDIPCTSKVAAWTTPAKVEGFVCPKALQFSVGFDSDMVLQRSPAKAAVYGQMVGHGHGASVQVTVSSTLAVWPTSLMYRPLTPTFFAVVVARTMLKSLSPNLCCPAPVAKSALPTTPAAGKHILNQHLLEATTRSQPRAQDAVAAARSTTSIYRVTFGDVYFFSGSTSCFIARLSAVAIFSCTLESRILSRDSAHYGNAAQASQLALPTRTVILPSNYKHKC